MRPDGHPERVQRADAGVPALGIGVHWARVPGNSRVKNGANVSGPRNAIVAAAARVAQGQALGRKRRR